MTKSHESDSDDDDFKHVCIIAVFLLVRLLYLHIHLFRLSIQIYTDSHDAYRSHRPCCSVFIDCLLFAKSAFKTDFLTTSDNEEMCKEQNSDFHQQSHRGDFNYQDMFS